MTTTRSATACKPYTTDTSAPINRDIDGAANLVDNFVRAYRCSAHEAADGRQIFEVPSFLALVTAALGQPLGLSENQSFAAGATAAVLGRANSYYAPKEKAAVLDSAIDAVLCIKTESVGVDFFDTRASTNPEVANAIAATRDALQGVNSQIDALGRQRANLASSLEASDGGTVKGQQEQAVQPVDARARQETLAQLDVVMGNLGTLRARSDQLNGWLLNLQRAAVRNVATQIFITRSLTNGGEVRIDVGRQYFEMVSGALLSVERILAQRLSNSGRFDAAGLTAELEALVKQRAEAQAKKDPVEAAITASAVNGPAALALDGPQQQTLIALDMKLLVPKLQTCVVRAKM